jgi:hypothetical protein
MLQAEFLIIYFYGIAHLFASYLANTHWVYETGYLLLVPLAHTSAPMQAHCVASHMHLVSPSLVQCHMHPAVCP